MGDFAEDTEVTGSAGRYEAQLSPQWSAWRPLGGYVLATALRAMGKETEFQRPASVSCQFLAAAEPGVVEITVGTLRQGKRSHALQAQVTQGGKHILSATAWIVGTGILGLQHDHAVMPDVPKPTALRSYSELAPDFEHWLPFWHGGVDGRPAVWDEVPTAREPIWRTWMRLQRTPQLKDPFLAAGRSLMWMDMMMWNAAILPHPWPRTSGPPATHIALSLDLSAVFHGSDQARILDEEWLLCDAHAPVADDGLMGCTGHLWSASGQLVASGNSAMLCQGSGKS